MTWHETYTTKPKSKMHNEFQSYLQSHLIFDYTYIYVRTYVWIYILEIRITSTGGAADEILKVAKTKLCNFKERLYNLVVLFSLTLGPYRVQVSRVSENNAAKNK